MHNCILATATTNVTSRMALRLELVDGGLHPKSFFIEFGRVI